MITFCQRGILLLKLWLPKQRYRTWAYLLPFRSWRMLLDFLPTSLFLLMMLYI